MVLYLKCFTNQGAKLFAKIFRTLETTDHAILSIVYMIQSRWDIQPSLSASAKFSFLCFNFVSTFSLEYDGTLLQFLFITSTAFIICNCLLCEVFVNGGLMHTLKISHELLPNTTGLLKIRLYSTKWLSRQYFLLNRPESLGLSSIPNDVLLNFSTLFQALWLFLASCPMPHVSCHTTHIFTVACIKHQHRCGFLVLCTPIDEHHYSIKDISLCSVVIFFCHPLQRSTCEYLFVIHLIRQHGTFYPSFWQPSVTADST